MGTHGEQTLSLVRQRVLSAFGRSTVSVDLVVLKDVKIQIEGYAGAVARLREAVTRGDTSTVYIALVEATNWLTSIADRERLKGNTDIQALGFARNRAHHQWASVIEDAGDGWVWRPAALLPAPDDPKHASLTTKPFYEKRLEGKPVLEVFDRLEHSVKSLAPVS